MFYDLLPFPASVDTLLCFIEFLTLSYRAPKAVSNVVASIRFHHERLGHGDGQFSHIRVRLALRSLAFTMRNHVSPAPPLPFRLLAPLVGAARILGDWDLPFGTLAVFAFFTFARLSSLVPPRTGVFDPSRWPTLGDLRVTEGMATLVIRYSKTRQTADGGFVVPLRASQAQPCPVALAAALLVRARSLGLPPSAPLFSSRGAGRRAPISLTQGQARRFLKLTLRAAGVAPDAFSFHSFRRGGCSLAFERGAAEPDLALQGDWRSAAVRSYYPARLARDRVALALADRPAP